jgi:hypothetical protein
LTPSEGPLLIEQHQVAMVNRPGFTGGRLI